MNVFGVLARVAMEEKVEGFESPPPMDKRILTDGFFCCTVLVKAENWIMSEEEMYLTCHMGKLCTKLCHHNFLI